MAGQFGYQKSHDGGGWMAGGSQPGSQGGDQRKSYAEESLRPVTIHQVLTAEVTGDKALIDGGPVTQITLVGTIRRVNTAQTMLTITVDDGTGTVDVKKFIDPDRQDEAAAVMGLEVNANVRIFGRIKSFANKQMVNAHVIRPVPDYNEVNYHMLEAAWVHLYCTRGPIGGSGSAAAAALGSGNQQHNQGADSGPMFVGGDMTAKLSGLEPDQRKLFTWMQKKAVTDGMNFRLIASGAGMTVPEVVKAAGPLMAGGLIYTTLDDDTWAILDY